MQTKLELLIFIRRWNRWFRLCNLFQLTVWREPDRFLNHSSPLPRRWQTTELYRRFTMHLEVVNNVDLLQLYECKKRSLHSCRITWLWCDIALVANAYSCLVGLVVAIDCRSRDSGFHPLVEPTNTSIVVLGFPTRKFSENSLDFGNQPCMYICVQAVVLSDYESKRVESAPASCRIISAK